MNILVCAKQVPDTTEIRIDPVKHTLIRDGVPSILNPFDSYALEMALRIRDSVGGRVTVLSMGPAQAKNMLRECLSVGADKAWLCTDRVFGGSDTLATSFILSSAVKALEEREGKFDLILCGKQAIDGDTAQVGPEIAEHLGYPQVTYAVEIAAGDGSVTVKREAENGWEQILVKTPCLITATKPAFDLRFPTLKGKMNARKAEIPHLTNEELHLDVSRTGLKGSPTKVKSTFTPPVKEGGVIIQEDSDEQSARRAVAQLSTAHII